MREIEYLFGNHKFWENTRKKHGVQESPCSSILKKYNMILINLTQTFDLTENFPLEFDNLIAQIITYEIIRFEIIDEVTVSEGSEEFILDKLIDFSECGYRNIQFWDTSSESFIYNFRN